MAIYRHCLAAVLVSVAIPCRPLLAEQPPQVVPMLRGETAPFSGQLLDDVTAFKLTSSVQIMHETLLALEAKSAADLRIETKRSDDLMALSMGKSEALKDCSAALDSCRSLLDRKVPWYASAWFWAPVSAIAGGASVAFAMGLATR